jgi:hypothetical protein
LVHDLNHSLAPASIKVELSLGRSLPLHIHSHPRTNVLISG